MDPQEYLKTLRQEVKNLSLANFDLIERNKALEKENTHLSILGAQVYSIK